VGRVTVNTHIFFLGLSSFKGEDFLEIDHRTNQKQELPVVAMFVNQSGRNEQSS
jgi:hypothetical protein